MSGRLWTEEQFNCPVCLDIPTEPVTIPCGHSYCMACIEDYWDNEGRKNGTYICPECRQSFSPRPAICRNTMLAEAMEQLRRGTLSTAGRESIKSARRAASSASERARARRRASPKKLPGSAVPCDRCPEPRAATRTCLVCMASFCENHLKPHNTQAKLKNHELIAPTGDLSQKICPEHKYLKEFFCRTCQVYICWLCTSNQHKGHETVSTQSERNEKQKELGAVLSENNQRLQVREKELKDMKKVLETLTISSDTVQLESDSCLSELQESLQRMLELLQNLMLSAGQEKINEAQDVQNKLETEVKKLKKKDEELKELINCQDNIYFLKSYQSLCSPLEEGDLGTVSISPDVSFDPVKTVVLQLREKVEDMCDQELDKINKAVYNTSAFTVTERYGQRNTGISKLFSGKGRAARSQGPPPLPSVSSRGPGATRPIAARNGNARVSSGVTSSTPTSRPQREERNNVRGQSPEEEEESDNWSVSSVRLSRRSKKDETEQADSRSIRSSRANQSMNQREQTDRWSLSSVRSQARSDDRETDNGEIQSLSQRRTSAADRQQPARQSDRWSLSSLLPRNRKKKLDTVKEAAPSILEAESTRTRHNSSSSIWGKADEVNPGLFLDSPTDNPFTSPAFPQLREISIDIFRAPEPRCRDDFLQYACDLTLDPSTAHRRLLLSNGDTVATLQQTSQDLPDVPQRFNGWTQVLCLQPLTAERCYWEVEWRGRGSSVGVACSSLPRKGADASAGLGYNSQSWSLELSDMCCAAMHGNQKVQIPVTYSPRVGVYLDRAAGSLTFYSVDDELVALHTFTGSFHSQLFAGFGVGCGVGVGLDFAMGQFSSTPDSIRVCLL